LGIVQSSCLGRLALVPLILCAACEHSAPAGAELTHAECADLVRHVQSLSSDDTATLRAAQPHLRADIDGCLVNGTKSAYRCVLQAEAAKDLEICESLFK
jgi:hypothetical protein